MNNQIIDNLDIINFAKNSKEFDIELFDEKKYGLIKVYGNENQPALFLKEVEVFDKETLKIISEIQHICWNFQKVLFLYVYSKTEIRIYNCSEKPVIFNENHNSFKAELKKLEVLSCKETDTSKLKTLNTLFSRIAIDTGFIWSATVNEAKEIRDKLKLQNRVDKYLISSLKNVSEKLKKEGLEDKDIIHKLVMRSLFLLYLEDKEATTKEFYKQFSENAKTYFDILKNIDVTYNLYKRLADDFNGSLFTIDENEKNVVKSSHLELIKKCFTAGYEDTNQTELYPNWRLFDFKIIRIELLSEIYENFLSELDKKDSGTYYTPPSLVELILNEKLPINSNDLDYKVKTLDPSCGSGIFLVQAFKRLVKRYEKQHSTKLTDFNILVEILKNNIFGIEIDKKSIKVAAFSLYLALLDNLDPKTSWWNGNVRFPNLINDSKDETIKKQGNNLFRLDTISNFEIEQLQDFQLIVGNPPFGTKNLLPSIKKYCDSNNFAKEMVLPFMHKATLLAPKGKIALIFNTKVLTNTGGTYQNFRQWLFNDNYVEKIYNFSILRKAPKNSGGQLFASAVEPICVIFYQKEKKTDKSDNIIYYSPKTYIKNDVLEGIIIDASDEIHLPRIECKKKDSKIWKVAMWGSYFDFELIKKFESNTLKKHFKENKNKWFKGTGLHVPSKGYTNKLNLITPKETINTSKISRYLVQKSNIQINLTEYLKIDEKLSKAPFLIVKKGITKGKIFASLVDFDTYFLNRVYGIKADNLDSLKILLLFFNSTFSRYFQFNFSSAWGLKYDDILDNELYSLPNIFNLLDDKMKKELLVLSNKILFKQSQVDNDVTILENEVDEIIYNDVLKLSDKEKIIIKDTLDFGLDLFIRQKNSDALKPVIKSNHYYNRLSTELNNWLDDVSLKASVTYYNIPSNCPLYLIKISFGSAYKKTILSKENIYEELKILDKKLWKEEAQNLYFRKKVNYYDGDDVYIIKPNQRRFWSETAAMEDSQTLLAEILNMKE
ncbi:class I SAM-dependent DNA methyltransferase [Polaribacter sp. Hel_I_88]|uniref:HsdM family class I SAM-dependent methyltransferase n=1 Tax=Polaribacter sp. Hel_I_88 TaxID=1250006 RepID=UPI00047A306C|nr:N-6 DNA methylase [Polaribacter sp. Hel_I_88]